MLLPPLLEALDPALVFLLSGRCGLQSLELSSLKASRARSYLWRGMTPNGGGDFQYSPWAGASSGADAKGAGAVAGSKPPRKDGWLV